MAEVFVPKTLEELLPAVNNEQKRIVAGCTDVVVGVRAGKLKSMPTIDINEVSEIKKIFEKEDKIYIGANVTIGDVIDNELIKKHFPVLIQAISTIGSIQIRNRATLGGNIGNASPSGDSIVVLNALDAEVVLLSAKGERIVKISDFIKGVGKKDLNSDEFIAYIVIDKKYTHYKGHFEKAGLRNSMIISLASMAFVYKVENDVIEDVRIACGAVAPKILVIDEANEFLKGKAITKENLLKAGEIIERTVTPIDDVRASAAYRKQVCKNLILRMLEI